MKKLLSILMVITLMASFVACSKSQPSQQSSQAAQKNNVADGAQTDSKNTKKGDPYMNPKVEIKIKDYGIIQLELDRSEAPITVENFMKLVNKKFYNGLTFHRIMEGFMMQGGDPNGDGTGGSEDHIKGEFKSNGVNNSISHGRGVISMARSMDPNSASSQFFICHMGAEFLDGEYAAFGHVTKGMDVVDKVCTDAKPVDGNGTIPKDKQPVIEYIKEIK